jgi:RNA polymerase sigma-70 factor (ECF subfamily)
MLRYCGGDERAFDELYAALAPRVLGYVRAILRDHAAADDVLQQTFIKLHGARHAYLEGADPTPWVYAIAHRTCVDELRRRRATRVRLGRDEDSVPEVAAGLTGVAAGAEENEAYREDQRSAVVAALALLPRTLRDAVTLTKLEGRTMREAAVVLGTSEVAVKLRAHRAYGRLRSILAGDEAFVDAGDRGDLARLCG